jgi:hypothetical protein
MAGTKAIIETNNGGSNNVVDFTYREEGIDGNLVPIIIAAPTTAGQTLAVDYGVTNPGAVTITPASTNGSAITTTGTLLVAGFNGTKAAVVLTSDNTAPSDGDTVTVGGQVYTFKTSLTASTTKNQVLINSTADGALLNLSRAINGLGTPGTDYGSLTLVNGLVTASTSVTSHTITLTARFAGTQYNGVATITTPSTHTSFGAATLGAASGATAGVDPLDKTSANLFTAAGNGTITGILAAGTFTNQSTGSTVGAGTTYDSATSAMAAGWILDDSSVGSTTIANSNAMVAHAASPIFGTQTYTPTLTQYQAQIRHRETGGETVVVATSAAALLTACKSFAINKASKGEARKWAPSAYLAPSLYQS